MAANTGERTLISAVIPPGAAHIDGVFSVIPGTDDPARLVDVSVQLTALTSDLVVRAAPKANIRATTVERIPAIVPGHPLWPELRLRYLRLVCVSSVFSALWEAVYEETFARDAWTTTRDKVTVDLGAVTKNWTSATPLRRAADRRQAALEIDALAAVALNVTDEELTTVYRTQFPVLAGYDKNVYVFDAQGRLVPNAVLSEWRQRDKLSVDERTVRHPESRVEYEYQLPFAARDREADLRRAHGAFSQRLARRRSNSV